MRPLLLNLPGNENVTKQCMHVRNIFRALNIDGLQDCGKKGGRCFLVLQEIYYTLTIIYLII